jgi:hypothetical protein
LARVAPAAQRPVRYAAAERGVAKRVTITFPSDRPYEFYATDVSWFAEELQSAIRHAELGTLNDIDRHRGVIWIDLADKHNLGDVKMIVHKMLERYSLTADAVISAA